MNQDTPPVIALLTDMGLSDWYVGAMKAVILNICPTARIVDICHKLHSQDVEDAAFMLSVCYNYFPEGSIFLCVVDPGVGSPRHAIIARTEKYSFVAPDNGLLSFVLNQAQHLEVRSIDNTDYWLENASQTFHGRDIFAPAAAHLANGVPLESFGKKMEKTERLPGIDKVSIHENSLTGQILYIDTYGNLLTNVTPDMVPKPEKPEDFRLKFKDHIILGLAPHFAAVPTNHPLMYWGSSGYLEIAINRASAQRKWDAHIGEWFELEWPCSE
ncbi:MAG: SAM hydrolase/SAM-dependent halogenase family protein [Candidatus Sumerlaeota bacterium]